MIDYPCTFLILDKNLQRFPFESVSFLLDRAVCRIPSIAFSVAALLEANTSDFLEHSRTEDKGRAVPRINPARKKYVHSERVTAMITAVTACSFGLVLLPTLDLGLHLMFNERSVCILHATWLGTLLLKVISVVVAQQKPRAIMYPTRLHVKYRLTAY